jgi:hypothetical protein
MYATLWLPLTEASPENSCLYVIPRCAALLPLLLLVVVLDCLRKLLCMMQRGSWERC